MAKAETQHEKDKRLCWNNCIISTVNRTGKTKLLPRDDNVSPKVMPSMDQKLSILGNQTVWPFSMEVMEDAESMGQRPTGDVSISLKKNNLCNSVVPK